MRYSRALALISVATGMCGVAIADEAPANSDERLDLILITDLGNPAYPGSTTPGSVGELAGHGSVDYPYRIGRTEVMTEQWLEFYNIFAVQSDEVAGMIRPHIWGTQSAAAGPLYRLNPNLTYPELSPVRARTRALAMYCNWLHNGRSTAISSLMDGAYDTSTFTTNDDFSVNDQERHHPGARYWIPTLDEHLKAFYYDPDKNGEGPGWWEYAFSSDEPPVSGLPPHGHVARDNVNHRSIAGPAGSQFTFPLKFYPDVQSPWGLLDTLGGEAELLEDIPADTFRGFRMLRDSRNVDPLLPEFDLVWGLELRTISSNAGLRLAARVERCGDVDLAQPYGVLDMEDVVVFLRGFTEGRSVADLVPDGSFDVDDLLTFLRAFDRGCK